MTDTLWFHLDVNPEPWAIGPVGYARRNGKMAAYVGRNAQLDAYKQAVEESVRSQYAGPMLEGKLEVEFFFWRNRAEYTTAQSRTHRKHEADATNMQKATEDALQDVLYKNDKDNVSVHSYVMAQGSDVVGQVVISVREVDHDSCVPLWTGLMPAEMQAAVLRYESEYRWNFVTHSDNVNRGPE